MQVQCKSGVTKPTSVINGWKVDNDHTECFSKFVSTADYIAKVEQAAKRDPGTLENAHANDRPLEFGICLYGMWLEEEWFNEYPFARCIEIGVASLAQLRMKSGPPISRSEARLFELFGHRGDTAT